MTLANGSQLFWLAVSVSKTVLSGTIRFKPADLIPSGTVCATAVKPTIKNAAAETKVAKPHFFQLDVFVFMMVSSLSG